MLGIDVDYFLHSGIEFAEIGTGFIHLLFGELSEFFL
jgi:hypothetical protein